MVLSLTVNAQAETKNKGLSEIKLTLNNQVFITEVALDDQSRAQGLSDRTELLANHAMLFAYAQPAQMNFWMLHMHFPLDILWLDSDKHVLSVTHDAEACIGDMACNPTTSLADPNTCRPGLAQSQCPLLASPPGTQYVLEVPAGTAKALNVSRGTPVGFELAK